MSFNGTISCNRTADFSLLENIFGFADELGKKSMTLGFVDFVVSTFFLCINLLDDKALL